MRFCVISSGSRANCTFVEGGGIRLLIDCGLSARQAMVRLERAGLAAGKINAILVTHEHSDHLSGVSTFSRRHRVRVYANQGTAAFIKEVHDLIIFKTGVDFAIGDMRIHPFSVVHDAADPVGFVLEADGCRVGQAIDLGKATTLVLNALSGCQAVILEANHDPQLLRDCAYAWKLKQRIASAAGHLSNEEAAGVLEKLSSGPLAHVVLSHLSENSNSQAAALAAVERRLDLNRFETLICASGSSESPLIEVHPQHSNNASL